MPNKDYLAVPKEEREAIFDYDPFLRGGDNMEIPCYRIYWDGDEIAQTNESLPEDWQRQAAWLMTYARDFVDALDRAIEGLRSTPNFQTSEGIDSHELAIQIEKVAWLGRGRP